MNETAVLLLTDIVDSTKLTERIGDSAVATLWQSHDLAARRLATQWKATELQRSDGFLFRFDEVDDAIEFAVAYHRALARLREPLHARVAIHRGGLEWRGLDEGGLTSTSGFAGVAAGISIPLTARINSLATAGQTLMSSDARTASTRGNYRIVSHGYWRLKGIETPIEIFETGDADAPFVPPPDAGKAFRVVLRHDQWLPRREVAHSLPAERNAFVGRKAALRDLETRLDAGSRLVSVVGPGGTGKTRLVQRFGWHYLGDYPGGIWYCDLSQATTFDGMCLAMAQGLNLSFGKSEVVEQIGNAIAGRGECLVVVDNFEQVVQYGRETLGRWLDRAIDARFVVTTRSVLGLDGEEVLSLDPLDHLESAALFQQRARAARRDFTIPVADESLLAQLVDLLDGLPLAIELAAARVRVLPLKALVERMRDRFGLLTSKDGRNSRQATLRATFDWSWDLLTPAERAGLAQISVFDGGFDTAAAEAVLDLTTVPGAPPVLDILQSLIEKSWVRIVGRERLGLLKSVQEYAGEQLAALPRVPDGDGSVSHATRRRHWMYYSALDETVVTAAKGIEIDNLVSAARRATVAKDGPFAVRTYDRFWSALKLTGPYRAGVELGDAVLALPDLGQADRALAYYLAGNALQYSGESAAASARYQTGLQAARDAGSIPHEARLLCALGEQHTTATRHEEAQACLLEALRLADSIDDQRQRCATLNAIGNLKQNTGELPLARQAYTSALAIARRLKDRRWEGGLLGNLASVQHAQGEFVEAQSNYERAILNAQEIGDRRWESNARCNLGLLQSERGDIERAQSELRESLAGARELGHLRLECIVSCNLGMVCEQASQHDEARTHYEHALRLAAETGDLRAEGQVRGYFGLQLARSGDLPHAREHLDRAERILRSADDQVSLAMVLCQRAESEALAGDRESALTKWSEADRFARTLALNEESPLAVSMRRVAALLRD